MRKLMMIFAVSLLLAGCKKVVVSDFCQQIKTIGYDRMLTKFTDAELSALNTNRKRALRDLRKAYDTHCTNKAN